MQEVQLVEIREQEVQGDWQEMQVVLVSGTRGAGQETSQVPVLAMKKGAIAKLQVRHVMVVF